MSDGPVSCLGCIPALSLHLLFKAPRFSLIKKMVRENEWRKDLPQLTFEIKL